MELLRLRIDIRKTYELSSGDRTVRMVLFGGSCDGDLFKGDILEGAVDTQLIGAEGSLSARYMLEGIDCEGRKCRLFIENNLKSGETETEPVIYTDSPALKWLETAELRGRIVSGSGLEVIIALQN